MTHTLHRRTEEIYEREEFTLLEKLKAADLGMSVVVTGHYDAVFQVLGDISSCDVYRYGSLYTL
jgi:hypothetical protein